VGKPNGPTINEINVFLLGNTYAPTSAGPQHLDLSHTKNWLLKVSAVLVKVNTVSVTTLDIYFLHMYCTS
jgi:hypothetical protein